MTIVQASHTSAIHNNEAVHHATPHNKMGLLTLTTLVTGNLVGSGAFMLPAALAAFGSLCLVGWFATSVGAIILSLIFAGLSARSARTGGPHTYVEDSFGRSAGFFTAWGYWVLSWISNAGLVVGAIGYASPLFGGLDMTTIFICEIGLIIFISAVNLLGVQLAGRFEIILTFCKVIPLIGLPLVGLFYMDGGHFLPFNATNDSAYAAVNATALITLWCFLGLETGTVPGSEVVNPKKNIPRAILLGTSLAAFIYIIGIVAIMGVVPPAELHASKAPYADLAAHLFGGSWAIPVSILASIACIGGLNGWTMIVSRIAHGAAIDGLFPKFFKRVTKQGAPLWGTVISSVCTIPFMALTLSENLLDQFNYILNVSVTIALLIYLACIASYFQTLQKRRQFKPHHALLGASGLLFSLWALTDVKLDMFLCSVAIVATGVPIWWSMHKVAAKRLRKK
jgi:APA family basic amino acid/polyamine antiporter